MSVTDRRYRKNPVTPIQRLFDLAPEPDKPRVHNTYHRTAGPDAIYIGRGSPWGNPYVIGEHGTREEVIELFRIHVLPRLDVTPLKDKNLVCFCKPRACHGDLLLEKANKES